MTVATAPAFTLATLRAGAVQIPAIGAAGAYWPLAAAAPAGFAGLDSDIKGVLVDWPVTFPALQDYAVACTPAVFRNRPRLPRARPISRCQSSIRTSSSRLAPTMKIICAR